MTGAKEGAVVVRWGYWLGDRGIGWEIGTETQEFWLGLIDKMYYTASLLAVW